MESTKHQQKRRSVANTPEQADELVHANVRTIAELEAAARQARTRTDRIVDGIATFCGSLLFVYLHATWFALWIGVNTLPSKRWHFDPFPFPLLTLAVSLDAIFLTTFILISQNRQGQMADRRNHLDLQVNLLAEQENTKMLRMLERIEKRLGIEEEDPTVAALKETTKPEKMVEQIKTYVEETSAEEGPLGVPERH
jgi:uncharacterized membrane protein